MPNKTIYVFCDGTWQTSEQTNKTNVALLKDAVASHDAHGNKQVAVHFDGVATSGSFLRRIFNGATGADIDRKILEAYEYLVETYEPGDTVCFVGFSRGAYTARSLNGFVYNCGILKKGASKSDIKDAYNLYRSKHKPNDKTSLDFRNQDSVNERPKTVLACFDTVGALGIPGPLSIIRKKHKFHDTQVNENTLAAFQAAAIDEKRVTFPLTPLTAEDKSSILKTAWFTGHHSSVGGGNEELTPGFFKEPKLIEKNRLAAIPALWLVEQIEAHTPLRFDHNVLGHIFAPDPLASENSDFKPSGIWKFFGGWSTRDIPTENTIHDSVRTRIKALKTYKPKNVPQR